MKEIPIDRKIEEFKIHLKDNPRVIFSAKFGDGKTYFLNRFIKKLSDEGYYFIQLCPVDYSVAKNEDIFEYIKRDILMSLAKDDMLSGIDFEAIADSIFTWENLREVISFLLSFVPAGRFYDKLISKAESFKKSYEEKKQTWKKYNSFFSTQRGGLYECDGYTKMIESALKYIKDPIEPEKAKKPVLIIEDLDRVDPGHLFRILNVLGAHIDCQKETNKFGFDNIIIVLDYEITRHIFHHFYGESANYDGYMSKFLSHYPFNYSITEVAYDYVYEYIQKECHLSREFASQMQTGIKYVQGGKLNITFDNKLKELSVRDVANALDNIENQYLTEAIETKAGYKIKTDVGIVKYFALLKRLRIDCSFLLQHISDYESFGVLNMAGELVLLNSFLHKGDCFYLKNGRDNIAINLETDENDITKCKFIYNGGGTVTSFDFKKTIQQVIKQAYRYIQE